MTTQAQMRAMTLDDLAHEGMEAARELIDSARDERNGGTWVSTARLQDLELVYQHWSEKYAEEE